VRARRILPLLLVLLVGGLVGLAAAKTPGHRHAAKTATQTATAVQTTTVTTTVSTTSTTSTTQTARATKPTPAKPAKHAKPANHAKAAKPKPPAKLEGWLGGGAFPQRNLVILPPSGVSLTAGSLHVSENGRPVGGLSLTPIARASAGAFGVVLVIASTPSMNASALQQAINAAKALGTHRPATELLGAVLFNQNPTTILPPTTSANSINLALSSSPNVSPGSRVLPALSAAYQALVSAGVSTGAVILITDGATESASADALTDAAQHAGIQTYTIGVRDAGFSQATRTALANLDSPLSEATPAQLPAAVSALATKFTAGYLVRYQSAASYQQAVSIRLAIDGVPGQLTAGYVTPSPPAAPPARSRTRPAHHAQPVVRPAPIVVLPRAASAKKSFWTSPISLVVIGVGCALLLAAALGLLLSVGITRRKLVGRVVTFIEEVDLTSAGPAQPPEPAEQTPGILERRRWWPAFVEQVDAARLKRSPAKLVRSSLWGSVGIAVLLMLLLGSLPLALLGLPVGPVVLRMFVARMARRQRDRFQERLPSHLQDLAGAMRAGRSIVGGLDAVAAAADEPVKGEFERALADESLGLPLEETLRAIATRMASEDMEQVALVAQLNRRSGSNVAEALDRVAEGARERSDLKREMKALTAQARISGRVLTGLPPMLLVAVSVLSPRYAKPMFHTAAGIVVLGICGFMVLMGWLVIRRIIEVEV
jgi:tight adherence protein B